MPSSDLQQSNQSTKSKIGFYIFLTACDREAPRRTSAGFFSRNPKCVGDLTPSIHARCQSPSYLDGNCDGLVGCRVVVPLRQCTFVASCSYKASCRCVSDLRRFKLGDNRNLSFSLPVNCAGMSRDTSVIPPTTTSGVSRAWAVATSGCPGGHSRFS